MLKMSYVICYFFQQLGCTSKFSLDLAQGLVKDYFVLIPKAVSGLQDLPQLAPQFTANFLTAVAEMYGVVGELPPISVACSFLLSNVQHE